MSELIIYVGGTILAIGMLFPFLGAPILAVFLMANAWADFGEVRKSLKRTVPRRVKTASKPTSKPKKQPKRSTSVVSEYSPEYKLPVSPFE